MGNLLLNSLEIQNFRGFRHLQIEHLGRVNLIVGKNNVGKSSLLEALYLYARRATPTLIWEFLDSRDESRYSPSSVAGNVEASLSALKYLFYGRKELTTSLVPVKIGILASLDEVVSITVDWYAIQEDDAGNRKMQLLRPEEYILVDNPVPRFTVQIGQQPKLNYPLRPIRIDDGAARPFITELGELNCVFTGAHGLSKGQIGKLWDGIALTGLEKDVLSALRIIAPGVEGLSLIEDSRRVRERDRVLERIPIVKIVDVDEPIPLRSLGDGTQRMLGIALALVNARDGILLIDEVENGLHYSIQQELWQLIFQVASRLNVQVFATTHSSDCIEGFQKAAQENTQEEGLLVRLSVKEDEIVATLFDERKLGIATREQIEVR